MTNKARIEANEQACLEIVERTHELNPTIYNAQRVAGFTKGTYTLEFQEIVKEVCEKYGVSQQGIELIILRK